MTRRRTQPDPWSGLLDFDSSPALPSPPPLPTPGGEGGQRDTPEPLAPTSGLPDALDQVMIDGERFRLASERSRHRAKASTAPTTPLPLPVEQPAAIKPGRPKGKSRHIPPYPTLSAVRGMWLFAMFDLPVETRQDRRNYTKFRKALLREGFSMLQFSVYALYCGSEEIAAKYRRRVKAELPPEGQVRLVAITDLQFGKQEIFFGKRRENPEAAPAQLLLF